MPAIRLFGRRWNAASDDFVYPGILEIVTRTAWMIVLLVVYIFEAEELDRCHNGARVQIFYIGTVALLMVYFIVNVSLVTLSARGYIMDPLPRRHVSKLLYVKLALLAPEIAWTILGTLWTFQLEHDCRPLPVILGKTIVVIEWVILCLVSISMYLMFDPLGKRHVKKRSLKDYNKMWRARCRFLCCCILQDENRREAFEEITELLSNFFRGRDYVLSDVLAGIVLLSLKQRYQDRHQIKVPLSEAPTLPIRTPRDYYRHGEAIPLTRSVGNMDTRHFDDSRSSPTTIIGDFHERTVTPGAPRLGEVNRAFVQDPGDTQTNQDASYAEGLPEEDTQLFGSTHSYKARSYGSSDVAPTTTAGRSGHNVKLGKANLSHSTSVASTSSNYSDNVFYPLNPPVGPKAWMTLENCAYYLRIATAIYGSSNYSGCYNCSDRIPLCKKYRWRNADQHLPSSVIEGDNWWECEVSSVMLYGGFSRDQIIYASLDNQIFKTPYVIVRDDAKKNVVISIRGTMSAGDALTDLTAQGENIYEENMPRGNVHKGVLKVARKMIQQLSTQVHLQDNVPRGYGLVVTGHSLGAGVAAILTLLLKNEYPDVVCFAFSPPGGLVSHSLSVFMQDFILSSFLGMDVVPRLGVITMEKLKSDLMVVIKNSRVPKYKILASGVSAFCCGWNDSHATDLLIEDAMTKRLTESMYQEICRDAHDTDSLNGSSISDADSMYQEMGPGVLYKEDSFCSSTTDYESENTDIELSAHKSDETHTPLSMSSSYGNEGTLRQGLRGSPRTGRGVRKTDSRPLSTSHAKWRQKQKKIKKGLAATEPLLLPGQILYLYEDEDLSTYGCCTSNPIYRTRWARPEEFNHVILDSKMMNHHNPYTIKDALEQILEQEEFLGNARIITLIDSQPKVNRGSPFAKPYAFGAQSSIKEVDEKQYSYSQYPDVESVEHQKFNDPRADAHVVDISAEDYNRVASDEQPPSGESKAFHESLVTVDFKEIEHVVEMEQLCLSASELDVNKSDYSEQNNSERLGVNNVEVDISMVSEDIAVNKALTSDYYLGSSQAHIVPEDNSHGMNLNDAATIVHDTGQRRYGTINQLVNRRPEDQSIDQPHNYSESEDMEPSSQSDYIEPGQVEDQAVDDYVYPSHLSEFLLDWHEALAPGQQTFDIFTSELTDMRDVFEPRISPVSIKFHSVMDSHTASGSHTEPLDDEVGYDSSSESSEVDEEQSECDVPIDEENQHSDLDQPDTGSHSSRILEPGEMITESLRVRGDISSTNNTCNVDYNSVKQQYDPNGTVCNTDDDNISPSYSSVDLQGYGDPSTASTTQSVNNEESSAETYCTVQHVADVKEGHVESPQTNAMNQVEEISITSDIQPPHTAVLVLEEDDTHESPETPEHIHHTTADGDGQSENESLEEVVAGPASLSPSEVSSASEVSSTSNEAEYPMEISNGEDTYLKETARGKYFPQWTDLDLPGDENMPMKHVENEVYDQDIGFDVNERESADSASSSEIDTEDPPAAVSSQKRFIHFGDDSDEYTPGITI